MHHQRGLHCMSMFARQMDVAVRKLLAVGSQGPFASPAMCCHHVWAMYHSLVSKLECGHKRAHSTMLPMCSPRQDRGTAVPAGPASSLPPQHQQPEHAAPAGLAGMQALPCLQVRAKSGMAMNHHM